MSFIVIVPTINAGEGWQRWIEAIRSQRKYPDSILVIDSASHDNTVDISREAGFEVQILKPGEFNHGAIRRRAVIENSKYEYVVFLTQDAILADSESLSNILLPFNDADIAAVCGRQLPDRSAGAIEAHARLFNYPEKSFVRRFEDKDTYGIKTAFLSNSFAAYRISALLEVDSFPKDVIFGEDMYVAAKMLKAGYKIAYAANACVFHSHSYNLYQEFKRYFDMGVFHARESWIREEFGAAENAGVAYVRSELSYLRRNALLRIPEAIVRVAIRYLGFRSGLAESAIPMSIKKKLSMNRDYFNSN